MFDEVAAQQVIEVTQEAMYGELPYDLAPRLQAKFVTSVAPGKQNTADCIGDGPPETTSSTAASVGIKSEHGALHDLLVVESGKDVDKTASQSGDEEAGASKRKRRGKKRCRPVSSECKWQHLEGDATVS